MCFKLFQCLLLLPVLAQVVPVQSRGDPKRPKQMSKAIRQHAYVYSQLPPSHWL